MAPRLMEGSEAIAEAMIAAGCRFFAGYPMTPFTEVLEHMAKRLPPVGGVCMNAESELEAVGMAWGAAATGTRGATGSTGQGLSLMQESIAELSMAQLPIVIVNMARAQGDYFQATRGGHGDYRRIVLAPMDVAEAAELAQLAFHLADRWRNPVMLFGDYYIAHTYQSVDIEPIDFGPLPANDWALTGATGGSGGARLVSPLGDTKQRDDVGYDLADYYHRVLAHQAEMIAAVEPMVEIGHLDDAELVVVAFGTPGKFVRYAVNQLRDEGRAGRLRAADHPVPVPERRRADAAAGGPGRRRLREQRRPDDRRRAARRARRRAGRLHRRPQPRRFRLRHRPRHRRHEIRARISRLCESAAACPQE